MSPIPTLGFNRLHNAHTGFQLPPQCPYWVSLASTTPILGFPRLHNAHTGFPSPPQRPYWVSIASTTPILGFPRLHNTHTGFPSPPQRPNWVSFASITPIITRRPDSSFLWMMHPLKTLKYALWFNYRTLIIKVIILACFVILLVLFFYAMPGYLVKKMLGA